MIKQIIDLLNTSDWNIGDEDIDLAKGKFKLPENRKEMWAKLKERRNGSK
jgi:hypothetical protein